MSLWREKDGLDIFDDRAGIAYVLLHTEVNFFIIDLCQNKSAT